MYKVLADEKVETWEGVTTFCFFWVLLIMAYVADCLRSSQTKKQEEEIYGSYDMQSLKVVDFYEKLIPLEQGKEPAENDKELTS